MRLAVTRVSGVLVEYRSTGGEPVILPAPLTFASLVSMRHSRALRPTSPHEVARQLAGIDHPASAGSASDALFFEVLDGRPRTIQLQGQLPGYAPLDVQVSLYPTDTGLHREIVYLEPTVRERGRLEVELIYPVLESAPWADQDRIGDLHVTDSTGARFFVPFREARIVLEDLPVGSYELALGLDPRRRVPHPSFRASVVVEADPGSAPPVHWTLADHGGLAIEVEDQDASPYNGPLRVEILSALDGSVLPTGAIPTDEPLAYRSVLFVQPPYVIAALPDGTYSVAVHRSEAQRVDTVVVRRGAVTTLQTQLID